MAYQSSVLDSQIIADVYRDIRKNYAGRRAFVQFRHANSFPCVHLVSDKPLNNLQILQNQLAEVPINQKVKFQKFVFLLSSDYFLEEIERKLVNHTHKINGFYQMSSVLLHENNPLRRVEVPIKILEVSLYFEFFPVLDK